MDDKKINDDDLYSVEDSADDELYAEKISLDKNQSAEKISDARPKTFRSKNFVDSETQAQEDAEKSLPPETKLKMKLTHAETSGVAISAVMLVYSLAEVDKPLFFLSAALLIFLLRPLLGALAGKHNRAVQNALHSFSVVMFVGALLFLFL